mmetsp:Transcript_9800/g.29166  ORF Transcript_9800/g.29166 Transcript_9800/m.29166 type:complete len:431 (-) Transcript_9800:22-1314(-)
MKHTGVSSKSDSSKDEESKGKLLSSSSLRSSTDRGTLSVDDNFSRFIITSSLQRFDEVTDNTFLCELVLVSIIVGVSIIKSVRLFALGSSLVELFTHFKNFWFLFFGVLILFIFVLVLFCRLQARDAVTRVNCLQESVGKLHADTISVHEVIINVLIIIRDVTFFVGKDSNLDLRSTASAHRSSVESRLAIILRIVDHLTLEELGGVDVSIVLHVLDLHTLFVATVTVRAVVFEFTTTVILLFFVFVPLAVFFARVAHLLLHFLLVVYGCLQIFLEVNNVFTKVVIARIASIGGTQSENYESFCGENGFGIFSCEFIVVCLDELTLLEFEGVARNINFIFFFFSVLEFTSKLGVGCGTSTSHQLRHVFGLGRVGALRRSEGVSRDDSSGKRSKGDRELHLCYSIEIKKFRIESSDLIMTLRVISKMYGLL